MQNTIYHVLVYFFITQLLTMKPFRLLVLIVTVFSFTSILCAQDPIFSQFYAAPLQLNPAFAGTTLAPRISLNYRNQWPAFDNAYTTMAASYEQLFEPLNSSVGLMLQSDNAGNGIYKSTNVLAAFGYRLKMNDNFFVKFGVEGGINQAILDWNKLIFLDQLDIEEGVAFPTEEERPLNLNRTYFDVGAGILAYSQNFYGGLSAKHINRPDETFREGQLNIDGALPIRLTFHAGGQFIIREGNKRRATSFVSPNLMWIQQGDFGQLNAGAYLGFGSLFGGLWYRHAQENGDAAIFLVGFQYDVFKIGYSYDFTTSSLASISGGTGGASEIAVTFNFENSAEFKRKRRANRYNDCFRMFR